MKKCLILFLLLIIGCSVEVDDNPKKAFSDNFFQYADKNDLINGNFEGDLLISELKKKGNFGIGTINDIDGEMLILDNNFYSIKSSGKVVSIPNDTKTPFANVKFFEKDTTFYISETLSLSELHSRLTKIIPEDKIAAVKVSGKYSYVKSRSIDAQKKPYPPLSKVIEEQTIFNFENIEGTIVGFSIPNYLEYLNFPGFHFHFLVKDLSGGGHLLDCTIEDVKVELDYTSDMEFNL